jgi:peptidyl-prolyl cis-trans isomerase B (cyclophilin B)
MLLAFSAGNARAQTQRLNVLLAEERRAPTANDVATIRAGMRSVDTDTALLSIRALGRLERTALIPDLAAGLRFDLPELRAEAASAIAASFGRPAAPGDAATSAATASRATVLSAMNMLAGRIDAESVPDVRGAIFEAIGRLPYTDADQAAHAEQLLAGAAHAATSVPERLGVAKGLNTLERVIADRRPPSSDALDVLRGLFTMSPVDVASRVRRLAFDTLLTANAVDDDLLQNAAADADPQVRLIAMTAAGSGGLNVAAKVVTAVVGKGLVDASPAVRVEALHAEAARETGTPAACAIAVDSAHDPDVHVALAAIDAMGVCGASPDAVALLEHTIAALSGVAEPRGWHRTAHAIAALATAVPDRGKALLPQFVESSQWGLRLYAVKAAAALHDRGALETLAADKDEAVAEEAARQLARLTGVEAPAPRAAAPASKKVAPSVLTPADLKRLAGARARITVRGLGSFEVALLTLEAPATTVRFARLAESGYYDGLTFDRVLANFVVQTRPPGPSSEPDVDPAYPRDELSAWPDVRGALGLLSDGRQPGDARLFLDLVDNPRFDYQYTVFAQTLNGLDVVDDLLEGDVIDTIEILP